MTMQSVSDDESRHILGEVLADQLQAILEYVQEIPMIKQELRIMGKRLDSIDGRLIVVEAIVREHEKDLRQIKQHLALA